MDLLLTEISICPVTWLILICLSSFSPRSCLSSALSARISPSIFLTTVDFRLPPRLARWYTGSCFEGVLETRKAGLGTSGVRIVVAEDVGGTIGEADGVVGVVDSVVILRQKGTDLRMVVDGDASWKRRAGAAALGSIDGRIILVACVKENGFSNREIESLFVYVVVNICYVGQHFTCSLAVDVSEPSPSSKNHRQTAELNSAASP